VSNLNEVISTCSEFVLELNLKKCHLLQTRIQFLGHTIENKTISPTPQKIDAVSKFKAPQNQKQLESFLGLTGYFRQFIQNYALISKPLTDLSKNKAEFVIGPDEENAIETLKKYLTSKPALAVYNPKYETEVHTDASIDGFGAVLLQKSSDDGQFNFLLYE